MNILDVLENLTQDTNHAIRGLWRKPGFTALIVLSLVLGVGVNTAIFAVADTVLLRPLPYDEPDRLVVITEEEREPYRPDVPSIDFMSHKADLQSYEAVMGFGGVGISIRLLGTGEPREFLAGPVASTICSIFRVQPQFGRCFTADEEAQEAQVALLSHRLWQNQFGGDPSVVGRTITIQDEPRNSILTIIGVMPAGFRLYSGANHDLWVPETLGGHGQFGWGQFVGRLKPGVEIGQALAEAQTLQRRLLPNDHEAVGGNRVVVQTLGSHVARHARTGLWILLSAAGLVLLIACANIASLLLGRGMERTREVAVRESLGAGRARLCRQFLTESMVLAALGGTLGVAGAYGMLQGIRSVAFEWLPRLEELQMSRSVFVFAAVASAVSAVLFGLVPAIRFSRVDLVTAMKTGSSAAIGGRHQQAAMSGLVIFQVAICVIAMMGAGLLINTVIRLNSVDLGIRPDHAAIVSIVAPRSETAGAFIGEVLERVEALPGVKSAGTANILLPSAAAIKENFRLTGMRTGSYPLEASSTVVSAGYFDAIGTSLLRGRTFNENDRSSTTPVAVVSDSFARRYWPDGKAVGKAFTLPSRRGERTYEIVGVAEDVRSSGLREKPDDHIYKVYSQGTTTGARLVLRTQGEPRAILSGLKDAIRTVDKDQTLDDFTTLETLVAEMVQEPRFYMIILGTFAGLALGLTALGVGGLASYAVTRRTREVGLRLSFGATPGSLYRMFGTASLKLVVAGLVLGAVVSLAVTQYVRALLFEITPTDPLTFAAVGALLTVVSLAACGMAARKAATMDPASVLRQD